MAALIFSLNVSPSLLQFSDHPPSDGQYPVLSDHKYRRSTKAISRSDIRESIFGFRSNSKLETLSRSFWIRLDLYPSPSLVTSGPLSSPWRWIGNLLHCPDCSVPSSFPISLYSSYITLVSGPILSPPDHSIPSSPWHWYYSSTCHILVPQGNIVPLPRPLHILHFPLSPKYPLPPPLPSLSFSSKYHLSLPHHLLSTC